MSLIRDILNKFKKKQEADTSKSEESPVFAEPVVKQEPKAEPAQPKAKLICDCGYKFKTNPKKTSKLVCPWCGKDLSQ